MAEFAAAIGNVRSARTFASPGALPLVARQVPAPAPAATPAPGPGTPQQAEFDKAEAFVKGGKKSKPNLTPGQGNSPGGFDAEYDPAAGPGKLAIKMRCAIEFKDGIDAAGKPVQDTIKDAVARAKAIKNPAKRRERLASFKWGPGKTDPAKVAFIGGLASKINAAWSTGATGHQFFLRKPQWDWIGAAVDVQIEVKDKGDIANPHMSVEVVKTPPDVDGDAFVDPGAAANAQDQKMVLDSNDLTAQSNLLRQTVGPFAAGSAALTGAMKGQIRDICTTYRGAANAAGVPDARSLQSPVKLTGHASSSGTAARNDQLAADRVAAVAAEFATNSFPQVATRVTTASSGSASAGAKDSAADRRVDVEVGDGKGQVTAVHEFGHAFGLGDEYANTPLISSTSAPAPGASVTHDPLVKNMEDASGNKLPGAVAENTDSIMSGGNVIRPQHYATFHKALEDTTNEKPWALGAPKPKPNRASLAAGGGGTPP